MTARLATERGKVTSFRSQSVMDYWLGNQRVKGSVKVMGTHGAKVRFNAEDPMGNVIADLACNVRDFVYVDHQNNCQLTGPCNRDSIAQLLGVPLAPVRLTWQVGASVPDARQAAYQVAVRRPGTAGAGPEAGTWQELDPVAGDGTGQGEERGLHAAEPTPRRARPRGSARPRARG